MAEEEQNSTIQIGIILVGTVGTGKSTLINEIFREYIANAK